MVKALGGISTILGQKKQLCYDLFVMLSARANMLLCHVITKLRENSENTRCQDGY